jgi:hypothetical protein
VDRALSWVLYEVQIRSANACHPDVGTPAQQEACLARPAPEVRYRARDSRCAAAAGLERIRLGTLDDMMEPTTDPAEGLTLAYLDQVLGVNALWLMPPFPNNAEWRLPDPCDNLGSPYAVQDYWHISGMLDRACIAAGRDETRADAPCWANDAFDRFVASAHARDMAVLLDVAFNHVGHFYRIYDQTAFRDLLAEDPSGATWDDFDATFDPALLHPEVLDDPAQLDDPVLRADTVLAGALDAVRTRCPGLAGDALVQAVSAWRLATSAERDHWTCDDVLASRLVPSLTLGAGARRPSRDADDAFTRAWYDVRFLFLRDDPAWRTEFLRNREYLFRVVNFWVSRGVDGFRLDHASNPDSGLGAEVWGYVIAKVRHYAALRGQPPPVFLAEEFHQQGPMQRVADGMTEGWLFDAAGRGNPARDAFWAASVMDRAQRFGPQTLVMTMLENHDELRMTDGTGYDAWTGRGIWALGAATMSVPTLLMGQEWGETHRLEFKRSTWLGRRHEPDRALIEAWSRMIRARRDPALPALRWGETTTMMPVQGGIQSDLLVRVRHRGPSQALLLVHNLWPGEARGRFRLDASTAARIGLDPCGHYRARDVLTGTSVVACTPAARWVEGINLFRGGRDHVAWAPIEPCTP